MQAIHMQKLACVVDAPAILVLQLKSKLELAEMQAGRQAGRPVRAVITLCVAVMLPSAQTCLVV